jgi:uncharacterized membrane protein
MHKKLFAFYSKTAFWMLYLCSAFLKCKLLTTCLTLKLQRMKIKWSTVKMVLQIIATIITSIVGTIAVQSCMA